MKKTKNKYYPKIKTVKYLELIDKIKFDSFLTLPQKWANFLDIHLVIQFLILFRQISDF